MTDNRCAIPSIGQPHRPCAPGEGCVQLPVPPEPCLAIWVLPAMTPALQVSAHLVTACPVVSAVSSANWANALREYRLDNPPPVQKWADVWISLQARRNIPSGELHACMQV